MPEISLALTACEGLIWRDTLRQHSMSVLGGSRERQPEDQLSRGEEWVILSVQGDMELIHPQ